MSRIAFNTHWSEMTFAVIGLGLIGGSYAKALRRLGVKKILGYNRTTTVTETALQEGVIDVALTDMDERLHEADVLIMAAYPAAIVAFLEKHQALLKDGAIITDAAGIKQDLGAQVRAVIGPQQEFISGHPMAGREGKGLALAAAELFDGANYIVVVEPENSPEAPAWLEALALGLGFGHTVRATPDEHDRIIAYTSDLPPSAAASSPSSGSWTPRPT